MGKAILTFYIVRPEAGMWPSHKENEKVAERGAGGGGGRGQ